MTNNNIIIKNINQLFISLLNNSIFTEEKNKNNLLEKIKPNTEQILLEFYNLFTKSNIFVNNLKINNINPFNIKINKIKNISQIPKPNSFLKNSFPKKINNYIEENSIYYIYFNIILNNRNINLYFILNKNNEEKHIHKENIQKIIKKYNFYIEIILNIIYFLDFYSKNNNCSKNISIYMYFNDLKKLIPKRREEYILNEYQVNSAFTNSCSNISNIILFRKEEWLKVLIHELFHSFGLDFSLIDNNSISQENINNKLKDIFKIQLIYKLYESYSEFWARFINVFITSYFISNSNLLSNSLSNSNSNNKEKYIKFLNYFNVLINVEIYYSIFQVVKILNYMDLKYENIIENNDFNINLKNKNYRENTDILCYYIITSILLNNYNSFINLNKKNNINILQFSNSTKNIDSLIIFIKNNYKKTSYLNKINNIENIYFNLLKKEKKEKNNNKKENNINYLLDNLRMTIIGFF